MTKDEVAALLKVLTVIEERLSVIEEALRQSGDHTLQHERAHESAKALEASQSSLRQAIEGLGKTLKGQF